MTAPCRVQLSRRKGWRIPENTVVVARPQRFSNPYRLVEDRLGCWCMLDGEHGLVFQTRKAAQAQAVLLYRELVDENGDIRAWIRGELAGRNLACWCRLCPEHAAGRPLGITCEACDPCHVDVLLAVANAAGEQP